jgi:hypothetical protein
MKTYRKRELRAADLVALTVTGFGVLMLIVAALLQLANDGELGRSAMALYFLGVVFLPLGLALNLKIHQLVQNGGREPEDYPGVPE